MALRTPLFAAHGAAGARFTEFAGWDMPLSYGSVADEHTAVRERCGCFDVSHMGEVEVSGAHALEVLQELTVNDVANTFTQFLAQVASDGTVEHVIYFLMPEIQGIPGVAALRPLLQAACMASSVHCHFIDLNGIWSSDYTVPGVVPVPSDVLPV